MHVELGSKVLTSDGQDAGTIEKLIVDPETGEVKAAVVRKGFLLTDDREVSLDLLESGPGSTARLRLSSDRLDELPKFDEGSYTAPPSDYASPYAYPSRGLLFPAGWGGVRMGAVVPPWEIYERDNAAVTGEQGAVRLQRDLANAVIDEGSDVRSREGEKVGEVQQVTFDPSTGEPLRIVVRKGFLLTEDIELSGEAIDAVDDGEVHLNLTADEVKAAFRRSSG